MAELLGTVASGIAVAEVGMKVGGTICKLRELWKEVQDVPHSIRVLMQHIEVLEPLVSDIQNNFDAGTTIVLDNGALQALSTTTHRAKISALCRSALCDLQKLVEELNAEVSSPKRRKREVGRIKVLLRKDDLKRFQSRLETAVQLLTLALTTHTAQVVSSLPQILAQQMATITPQSVSLSTTKTLLGPCKLEVNDGSQDQEVTKGRNRRRQRNCQQHRLPSITSTYFGRILTRTLETGLPSSPTWMARFQAPSWLSRRVWEIQACSGWQFNITTFSVVPGDSLVFRLVWNDDWDGLCDLFRKGLASPLDCDEYGSSLFEMACYHSSSAVVRGLVGSNQTRSTSTAWCSYRFLWELYQGSTLSDTCVQITRGLSDLVADEILDLDPKDMDLSHKSCLLNCIELLGMQVDTFFPGWYDLRPRDKYEFAAWYGWTGDHVPGSIRRVVRKHGPIQADDVRTWQEDGIPLLHWVCKAYGSSVYSRSNSTPALDHWEQLVTEIVHTAPTDLHLMHSVPWTTGGLEVGLVTPFVCFLDLTCCSAFQTARGALRARSLSLSPRIFLTTLKSCGVNLQEYARREFELWGQEYGARHVEAISCVSLLGRNCKLEIGPWFADYIIEAIHYGPNPEDWVIDFDRCRDFPATFWNWAENPPRKETMPGTWMEDE